MLFFGKPKAAANPAEPKRRSTFGLLFNPEIGKSLQPLGETTNVFVQLIAMIFAMNGLFPKNHPGIQGVEGAKLSLTEIFSTAWRDLSFTKAGLPKVILFFAVTGTLIFAILSLITALMAGFMGTAHAATGAASTGFFSPVGSDDLAQNWLDYIFKGTPLSDYYAQNGKPIPQTVGIQCGMMAALGFYSGAMLVFAAVILFYHLVSMVVNTAHEGVAMGKKTSQVWAPIRLVVAVGLLIPMGGAPTNCGSGSGAGLNAGQYIVIQMASWGSGLASQSWKVFITSLSNMNNQVIKPSAPDVEEMVTNVVMMEACKFAWNLQLCETDAGLKGSDPTQCAQNSSSLSTAFPNEAIEGPKQVLTDPNDNNETQWAYTTANQISSRNKYYCGDYIIPGKITTTPTLPSVGVTMSQNNSDAVAAALSTAQKATFEKHKPDFVSVGQKIYQLMNPIAGNLEKNTAFVSLVNAYRTDLKKALDAALTKVVANNELQADTISSMGWAGAGAWLNTIARDQSNIASAYQDGLPRTRGPDIEALAAFSSNKIAQKTAVHLTHLSEWAESTHQVLCASQEAASAGGSANTIDVQNTPGVDTITSLAGDPTTQIGTGGAQAALKSLIADMGSSTASGATLMQKIFSVIDAQAQRSGIWQSAPGACGNDPQYFTLGAQLVTANPLQEFSFWGFANIRASYSLWEDILQLSVASIRLETEKTVKQFTEGFAARDSKDSHIQNSLVEMGLKSQFYAFVASIFGMFANIFFICGFTVAFVAPLLPYFRFFFNVLTWIVSLFEAIVAVPLLALAHLNPEGEGLPGQSAKAGYFMIFNIFVRPVLTVFGLITGLIVFYVAIMLLNFTFAVAIAGTNASYHTGLGTLVRIIYTIMYGATVYVCANNAFKTIGFFPEHALRWIGAQAHHERMGDGGRAVQGVMGQAQGQLGERAIGLIRLKPPN